MKSPSTGRRPAAPRDRASPYRHAVLYKRAAPRYRAARLLLPLCLFLSAATLAGCSPRVGSFGWKDPDGRDLVFTQSGGFPEGEENRFSPAFSRNAYKLEKPAAVPPGKMISIRVRVAVPGLTLSFGRSPAGSRTSGEVRFAAMPGTTTFYIESPAEGKISALSVRAEGEGIGGDGAGDSGGIEAAVVESIAISPAFRGYERAAGGEYRISEGFGVGAPDGSAEWTIARPFSGMDGSLAALSIRYSDRSAEDMRVSGDTSVLVGCGSARKSVTIPRGVLGPSEGGVSVRPPDGVRLEACFAEESKAGEAAPVDPGVVLLMPPFPAERDFASYSWDLVPKVLIFDFRDYATQDAYLKRIAFYVEKKGFAGRLASDEEIAPLHGWNAHDYKAEDLAGFFSLAASTGFALNGKEQSLRDFLVDRKILARKGNGYSGSGGAILSITRESPDYLRRTFLTHESLHAIYFADAGYRNFIASMWDGMSGKEKWFWYVYFGWMRYDTGSPYLMANEMQAYLAQQSPAKADAYFRETLPGRILEKYPELEKPIGEYMAEFGGNFRAAAERIDGWLRSNYGFGSGRTYFLR